MELEASTDLSDMDAWDTSATAPRPPWLLPYQQYSQTISGIRSAHLQQYAVKI